MDRRINRGFTLTELVITLAVGAIFLTVAVPSYYDVIQRNRISSLTNQLVGHLNLARSESIKRGVRVNLCPALSNTACDTKNNWKNGWLVFVDSNLNGGLNAGEEILLVQESVVNDVNLDNASISMGFDSNGFFLGNQSSFTLWSNHCSGTDARAVTISRSGRLSTDAVNCP